MDRDQWKRRVVSKREARIAKLVRAHGFTRVSDRKVRCPHCGAELTYNLVRRVHLTGRCV